jgi:hypothetical protein
LTSCAFGDAFFKKNRNTDTRVEWRLQAQNAKTSATPIINAKKNAPNIGALFRKEMDHWCELFKT